MSKNSEAQTIRNRAIDTLAQIQQRLEQHASDEVVTGALLYTEEVLLNTARGCYTKGKRSPVYENEVQARLRAMGYENEVEEGSEIAGVDDGSMGD